MIHVPNRPNVHVRLAAIEFLFSHLSSPNSRSGNVNDETYLLPTFAMISSATDFGTSSYTANCME